MECVRGNDDDDDDDDDDDGDDDGDDDDDDDRLLCERQRKWSVRGKVLERGIAN